LFGLGEPLLDCGEELGLFAADLSAGLCERGGELCDLLFEGGKRAGKTGFWAGEYSQAFASLRQRPQPERFTQARE
jgi:hypothetical protein